MTAPIVFFDLAAPDSVVLRDFYEAVFGWSADEAGQFSVPAMPVLDGAFRSDPAEKRIYLGVPDVAAALDEGTVDTPRFEVPGVVILGLFRDPAGNPMGLIEMEGDSPRVP